MDTLGNVLKYKHYILNQGCRNASGDLVAMADKGAICWGSDTSFFALRVDSSLAPIWAKRFGRHGGIQFIKELPSGDLLAGINTDTAGAIVARMDANGNFLWIKSYFRPKGMVHDAVIESDDSFIITGYTDSTSQHVFLPLPPTYHPKLFMMELNGTGEVLWCRGYDSAPHFWYAGNPSRIVKTLDGKYALLATLGYPQNNLFFRPFLMKTDLNGDTLWTRSVGTSGFDQYAMDLFPHSDGGLFLSGYVLGDLPEMNLGLPYIFKTDSLGHFSCAEGYHPVQLLDLFPTDSSFALNWIDGVLEQPAFMSDANFPFATYDACTVLAVSAAVEYAPKQRIRPNPNTGRFTVQFQDPLLAESYYSVYDTMGKLLVQRRLPAGATLEEVDLSRFGRGTYVLKFTSPDGVCHERVVVE